MAAQYTEVTLEDMEKFLKRGYRALRPQQGASNREYYYDLNLSEDAIIRVWTSVQRGADTGAGVGEDAIRVQFLSRHTKKPLVPGKAPIVKRTQGWRNTLQTKIEDVLEMYEDRAAYWDGRSKPSGETRPAPPSGAPAAPAAPATGMGPSDKQVNFVRILMQRANANALETSGVFERFRNLEWPFSEQNIRSMPGRQVSVLIDALKNSVGSRYAAEAAAEAGFDGVD